jgi:hypothetical protein
MKEQSRTTIWVDIDSETVTFDLLKGVIESEIPNVDVIQIDFENEVSMEDLDAPEDAIADIRIQENKFEN